MRPLEIALLAGVLLMLIALAVPRLRERWSGLLVGVPVLLAATQALFEGPRWQMVPAYVLSGLLLLVWLLLRAAPAGGKPTSLAQRIAAGFGVAVAGLAFALAAALPAAIPVFSMPEPTGPYGVGKVAYHWVDESRAEPFTADPDDRRELMVYIWYPAEKRRDGPRAPYVHHGEFAGTTAQLGAPSFFLDHLRYVRTHAQPSAPAAGAEPFPVVISASGRGGQTAFGASRFEELASHGYIIAAIDHPYASGDVVFPDGRHVSLDERMNQSNRYVFFNEVVYPLHGQDAVFVLNQLTAINEADPNNVFTGRIDLERAGMIGASLGAAATGEACRIDQRFRACLGLDGRMPDVVVESGLQQPTMWIGAAPNPSGGDGGQRSSAITTTQGTARAVFDKLPGPGYFVSIAGMAHPEIADYPYFIPPPLGYWYGTAGRSNWRRTHEIINAYTLAFLNKHLKGMPETLLDGPSPQFPDVVFEWR